MPREYEEIVLYLEGKRSLDLLLARDSNTDMQTQDSSNTIVS